MLRTCTRGPPCTFRAACGTRAAGHPRGAARRWGAACTRPSCTRRCAPTSCGHREEPVAQCRLQPSPSQLMPRRPTLLKPRWRLDFAAWRRRALRCMVFSSQFPTRPADGGEPSVHLTVPHGTSRGCDFGSSTHCCMRGQGIGQPALHGCAVETALPILRALYSTPRSQWSRAAGRGDGIPPRAHTLTSTQ